MTQGFFPDLPSSLTSSFLIDVAKGKIQGHSIKTILMRNPDVSNTETDLWGGGGDMIFPTAAESWEIVSDNVNDTAAGTGAQVVLIAYLDGQYNPQQIIVPLDGITPVQLNDDHFRPDDVVVVASGSGRRNEGLLTVRVSGAGATRRTVQPTFSVSQDCHFTVPAGFTIFSLKTVFAFPSGNNGFSVGKFVLFGTNTEITTGRFPFFQTIAEFDIEGQFAGPEKTDFFFTASSSPANADVNAVFVILVIDNNFIGAP